jgi:hypothetical protein
LFELLNTAFGFLLSAFYFFVESLNSGERDAIGAALSPGFQGSRLVQAPEVEI